MHPSILTPELATIQHEWLRGARSRLLRVANIAHRRSVLEVGAGHGLVTQELVERCRGKIHAIDRDPTQVDSMRSTLGSNSDLRCADVSQLPFGDESFDLVFSQFACLWFDLDKAMPEIIRVLEPNGTFVAIEPDYGGIIEYPVEMGLRSLWIESISAAGGNAFVGREMAAMLLRHNFRVDVYLSDRIENDPAAGLEFLRALIPYADESQWAALRQHVQRPDALMHLPLFMIRAQKNAV